MSNRNFDDNFREEELFQKFIEKQQSTKKQPDRQERKASTVQDNTQLTDDDLLLEHLRDLRTDKSLLDTGVKNPTVWLKIKAFFRFLTDEYNAKRIACIGIPGFLILYLLINIITPSADISEKENRALAKFPTFNMTTITDGSFMSGFEKYISDQFVFRNAFVVLKRKAESLSGKKENHEILFSDDDYLIQHPGEYNSKIIQKNTKAIEDLAKVGRYNITLAVAPTAYEVLKEKLPAFAYTDSYSRLIKTLKANIKSNKVKIPDVESTLRSHKNQYIYYRTDHHQTALGSYYLYTSLAKPMSFQAYDLKHFNPIKKSDSFYGTTWSKSGFASTKPDEITQYVFDGNIKCSIDFPLENKSMKSLYSDSQLAKKDKYAYYLDGNHALEVVHSSCGTGKKLAVIKDSYAHSLLPYLVNHYETIYMLDLRYYNDDILEYLYNNNINDVLILYNESTFMTDTNLTKISSFYASSPFSKVPSVSYGKVPEQTEVDASYFDDAVFVGDSLTIGISYFSEFNAKFLCMGGLSTKNLETDLLPNGSTVLKSIESMKTVGKLYIMLGTNEALYQKPEEFILRYSDFIDKVRKKFPNVIVYVESIMPISKAKSEVVALKNSMITEHNKYLLNMAIEKQCYYIDLNSFFADKEGYLPADAGEDGIHLSPDNYRLLAKQLRLHAVPVAGIKKIENGKTKSVFKAGGKYNTAKIGDAIVNKIPFKDTLAKVSDSLIISNYKPDTKNILSAAVFMGGGSTAEEVAVFELGSEKYADSMIELVKKRIERKKKDFENYMPAEMPKLNNPLIVKKGNIVVVCISDSATKADIEALIQ